MPVKINSKVKSLFLLSFISLFLTACSLKDLPVIGGLFKGKEKPVTLSVWGLWEPKEVVEPVLTDYKQKKPTVAVEYEERSFISPKSYKESVTTRLSEGSAPDIILVHNSWVPYIKDSLAPASSKIMTVDQYSSSFYPVAKESAVFDDKIYAIPLSYDGLALVYNKDMFNEAGISSPPSTWEEFRVDAVKLTKRDKENIVQAGASMGTANNVEHFSDILGLLFAQGSVKFPDDIDSQAAVDILSFYTNFATTDKVWSDILQPSVEAFADGKVAMIFVPSWQILNILARNPQVNIGVAQVPRQPDLSGNPIVVDWGSFWMFAVSKDSKNANTAWEFLKYLTSEDGQKKLFSESSKVRAFGQAYSLQSLQGDLSGNAYLDPYVKSAPTAKSGLLAGRSGNDREVDVMKTAVNAILSGTVPSEAAAAAKTALNK